MSIEEKFDEEFQSICHEYYKYSQGGYFILLDGYFSGDDLIEIGNLVKKYENNANKIK